MPPCRRPVAALRLAVGCLASAAALAGDWFPGEALFAPPVADPRQPRFFAGALSHTSDGKRTPVSAFGFGESFGIYRRGSGDGAAWQVDVSGGIIGLLDLEPADRPLINTDYLIGFPISWRNGSRTLRLQIYHQSSHLADDYLRLQPQRYNDFQYEAAELLLSRDWGDWRLYGGGEYRFRQHPERLAGGVWHGGIDIRRPRVWRNRIGWIGGLDVRRWQERPRPAVALTTGLSFGGTEPGDRRIQLVLELYRGYSPFGSLFEEDITYRGLAFRFGF